MPRGGNQPLRAFEAALGLPDGFTDRRGGDTGALYGAAVTWIETRRPRRQNHWPALVLSLVAVAEGVVALAGEDTFPGGLDDPRLTVETPADGEARAINTLNVSVAGGDATSMVRLRGRYDAALNVISVEMRRKHPSNQPHATQSWPQYRPLIDLILAMTPAERTALAEYVWEKGVLASAELVLQGNRSRQPRPFLDMVESFDTASRRGGALFQALVYAYFAADAPTLRIESNAVNTGASRAGAIGDVDGYDGEFVVLGVEAKDKDLTVADEDDLLAFIEDADSHPDMDAVVVARSFDSGVRALLEGHGIRAFTRREMAQTVRLWDPTKQSVALKAMRYFLLRIQKDPDLLDALGPADAIQPTIDGAP